MYNKRHKASWDRKGTQVSPQPKYSGISSFFDLICPWSHSSSKSTSLYSSVISVFSCEVQGIQDTLKLHTNPSYWLILDSFWTLALQVSGLETTYSRLLPLSQTWALPFARLLTLTPLEFDVNIALSLPQSSFCVEIFPLACDSLRGLQSRKQTSLSIIRPPSFLFPFTYTHQSKSITSDIGRKKKRKRGWVV